MSQCNFVIIIKYEKIIMKKLVIKKNFPGAGNHSPGKLQLSLKTSGEITGQLCNPYQWIQFNNKNSRRNLKNSFLNPKKQ